jgi:outer membrane receptor protein involved in Fe transport
MAPGPAPGASAAPVQVAQATPAQPAGGSGTVEEVVVTANKREQRLNKVGQTVTAISGRQLENRHVTSVQDIAATTPGLEYSESGSDTPIYTLRGVGFNETTLGVFPDVSVYIDEVPLPFPAETLHSAYDLQRVEVLKGPQGTLFGENATGGAVNYIANKPTDTFSAGTSFTYGSYNDVQGTGYVSGPLAPGLTARFAITGERADGWQYSYTRPSDHNGALDYVAGRAIFDYQANDDLKISLRLDAWNDQSQPQAPQFIALRPQIPAGVQQPELNYPFPPSGSLNAADWNPGPYAPQSSRQLYQAALRADWTINDSLKLTSLTSFSHFDENVFTDEDGTSLLIANVGPSFGRLTTVNQELRLSGTTDKLRWVAGLNYEHDYTNENQSLDFAGDSSSNPATLNIATTGSINTGIINNYAAFGNVEYDVLPDVTLKAGARYTESDNSTEERGICNGNGLVCTLFNIIGQEIGTQPFPLQTTGGNYTLNFNHVPGFPFFGTLDENNVAWRGGADWRVNDHTLLYANISRGFKAGSFPTLAGSTFAEFLPVKQESVTSYEAGFKAGLFDHSVQLNAAGFYYTYDDKQERGKIIDPIFDVLDVLINVPRSHIYGGEADATWLPIRHLTLSAAVTYLQSGIDQYSGPSVYGIQTNFAGTQLPFTPRWAYSLTGDYRPMLANGGIPFLSVTLHGQSSETSELGGGDIGFFTGPVDRHDADVSKPFLLPDYTLVDASVGYEFPDHQTTLRLVGKNIFNKLYFTNAVPYLDVTVRYPGLPAFYGVELSRTF